MASAGGATRGFSCEVAFLPLKPKAGLSGPPDELTESQREAAEPEMSPSQKRAYFAFSPTQAKSGLEWATRRTNSESAAKRRKNVAPGVSPGFKVVTVGSGATGLLGSGYRTTPSSGELAVA